MHRDDRAKSRAAYCNLITSTPLGERSANAQTHTQIENTHNKMKRKKSKRERDILVLLTIKVEEYLLPSLQADK